jgi:hypothetical protein
MDSSDHGQGAKRRRLDTPSEERDATQDMEPSTTYWQGSTTALPANFNSVSFHPCAQPDSWQMGMDYHQYSTIVPFTDYLEGTFPWPALTNMVQHIAQPNHITNHLAQDQAHYQSQFHLQAALSTSSCDIFPPSELNHAQQTPRVGDIAYHPSYAATQPEEIVCFGMVCFAADEPCPSVPC